MLDDPASGPVLDHGGTFRPRWWQRPTVPAEWSAFLSELPPDERGRGYHRITRRNLLADNQDRSPDASGRLLLACYVWGTGDGGWLAPRRARVFGDTPPEVLAAHLIEARRILDTDGPEDAYTAFSDGGPLRVKHMRASFFTKYLYAADAPGDGSCGRALILDQFVAIALNDRHAWALRETGPWTTETYQRWLDHAHSAAQEQAARSGHLVRPDAVEMDYFKHGRQLARQRRAERRASR